MQNNDRVSTTAGEGGRKSSKPIMEKRRRARINASLAELKSLLLEAIRKEGARHNKMEKADILEMAVKHLRQIQRQQINGECATDNNSSTAARYHLGFQACAQEVSKYLGSNSDEEIELKTKLLNHLANCVTGDAFPSSSSSSTSLEARSPDSAHTTNDNPTPTSTQTIPLSALSLSPPTSSTQPDAQRPTIQPVYLHHAVPASQLSSASSTPLLLNSLSTHGALHLSSPMFTSTHARAPSILIPIPLSPLSLGSVSPSSSSDNPTPEKQRRVNDEGIKLVARGLNLQPCGEIIGIPSTPVDTARTTVDLSAVQKSEQSFLKPTSTSQGNLPSINLLGQPTEPSLRLFQNNATPLTVKGNNSPVKTATSKSNINTTGNNDSYTRHGEQGTTFTSSINQLSTEVNNNTPSTPTTLKSPGPAPSIPVVMVAPTIPTPARNKPSSSSTTPDDNNQIPQQPTHMEVDTNGNEHVNISTNPNQNNVTNLPNSTPQSLILNQSQLLTILQQQQLLQQRPLELQHNLNPINLNTNTAPLVASAMPGPQPSIIPNMNQLQLIPTRTATGEIAFVLSTGAFNPTPITYNTNIQPANTNNPSSSFALTSSSNTITLPTPPVNHQTNAATPQTISTDPQLCASNTSPPTARRMTSEQSDSPTPPNNKPVLHLQTHTYNKNPTFAPQRSYTLDTSKDPQHREPLSRPTTLPNDSEHSQAVPLNLSSSSSSTTFSRRSPNDQEDRPRTTSLSTHTEKLSIYDQMRDRAASHSSRATTMDTSASPTHKRHLNSTFPPRHGYQQPHDKPHTMTNYRLPATPTSSTCSPPQPISPTTTNITSYIPTSTVAPHSSNVPRALDFLDSTSKLSHETHNHRTLNPEYRLTSRLLQQPKPTLSVDTTVYQRYPALGSSHNHDQSYRTVDKSPERGPERLFSIPSDRDHVTLPTAHRMPEMTNFGRLRSSYSGAESEQHQRQDLDKQLFRPW